MNELLRDSISAGRRRQRRPLRRGDEAVAGILAVIAGLKPAYLYDIGEVTDPDSLARAVAGIARLASPCSTATGDIPHCELCVLVLQAMTADEDEVKVKKSTAPFDPANSIAVFVADRIAVFDILSTAASSSNPIVQPSIKVKAVHASDMNIPMIDVSCLPSQHNGGTFDKPKLAEQRLVCEAANAIAEALGSDTKIDNDGSPTAVIVPGKPHWPYVALFGLVLGYPVIYCDAVAVCDHPSKECELSDTERDPSGACLSGQDLLRYSLRGRCVLENKSELNTAVTTMRELTSFTFPYKLTPGIADAVAESTKRWKRQVENVEQHYFSDIEVSIETVNHPAVAL